MESNNIERYIQEYGKSVYSFCMYITKNKYDAEDIYQQTFLIAFQKNEIDSEKNPKSYLITIAANVWNNVIRKKTWRKEKADIVPIIEEELNNIPDSNKSPEERVVQSEEETQIRKLVVSLPDKLRAVILMYYMEDMSINEIAAALGIPAGTVKSRMNKAKKMLKEKMSYDR